MFYANPVRFLVLILFLALLSISVVQTDAVRGAFYAHAHTSLQPTVPGVRRLIVQLNSPPLAATLFEETTTSKQKVDVKSAAAATYVQRLRTEQAAFINAMQTELTGATVATYRNEAGFDQQAAYQIVFNGLAVDPGTTPINEAYRQLANLPGVKQVYIDQLYYTQLYTSTYLINTPVLWNALGNQNNAGVGVKIAFMDGGVHHLAPMMNGSGYQYPSGYGPNGLGQTANNNGKIIVSRTYFRPWDAPTSGDENAWPGVNGTSHGMHTASIAAGGAVNASYNGFTVSMMSGIAPKAYVMSYRVFYPSVNGSNTFYTTEGLAALEDIVKDGADILNASWGNGPESSGGQFDPLDQALINATKAGIFVAVSNGNAGPNLGTSDHPSSNYMNVAASTTGGTLVVGSVRVPSLPNLAPMAFGSASFGASLPANTVVDFPYLPAVVVDPNNVTGCTAFPANAFAGKAILLNRGNCDFSLKVFNAQQAGATLVIVYNSAAGGDDIQNMGAGANADQVTIASAFIGKTNGEKLISHYTTNGEANAILQVDTKTTFQAGSKPDRIIAFSSRGPGVGGTLKPDIAAPGVNILAQGYTDGVTGEARHLGYGQASGTSMASPHVAGAAALLRQLHPNWSTSWIKSALMSTAKYRDIYLADGTTPAQPLDMGAGRLDLTKAINPGVILNPPSLSFGYVYLNTQKTLTITLTSVATTAETYNLSTLYTGDGFAPSQVKSLPGFQVNPASVTLNPGETKQIQITFHAAANKGIGDSQGYIILDGATYDAHIPTWARVVPALPLANILLVDGDFSTTGTDFGFPMADYRWYYTDALDQLGYTYTVLDYDLAALPNAATLSGYRAIIYFTGDNYVTGSGLTGADMDKLVEYTNAGGTVIVMGQDMAATIDHNETDPGATHFFYASRLGANWIQDSISNNLPPTSIIDAASTAPALFANVHVDLTQPRRLSAAGPLSGTQEVPPVNTLTTGSFSLFHDLDRNYTEFQITIIPSALQPITMTGMHIHSAAAGNNGPVIRDLAALGGLTLPKVVTNTLRVSGVIFPSLNAAELQQLTSNGLYVNVHTTVNPSGAIRGQIKPLSLDNQAYMDEIDNHPHNRPDSPITGEEEYASFPLFAYPGAFNIYNGTVALAHRQQPSLENPGITYPGRSVYMTFGLEGMSNRFNTVLGVTPTTRSELMALLLAWSWSEPPTTVQLTDQAITENKTHRFEATTIYGQARQTLETTNTPVPVRYRWDFGDQSSLETTSSNSVTHAYTCTATNKLLARVEITDNYGNVIIGTKEIDVTNSCTGPNVDPPTPTYTPTSTPTPTPTPTLTPTPPASDQKAWTMLLYLAGDTGRIDGGTVFGELKKAIRRLESEANPNVNVVALLDGPGDLDAFRVTFTPQARYTPLGEIPMDDPLTLVEFVNQAKQEFPAEHYYLVIADHANGVQGIAWDTTTAANKTALLTPTKLEQAFKQISNDGVDPIDVVHFDGCSFGLLENVAMMHNYADYLVISQNIGWSVFGYEQYRATVTATTGARALALAVAQGYGQTVASKALPYTISTIDTAQTAPALSALTDLAAALNKYMANDTSKRIALEAVRTQSQKFDSARPLLEITNDDWYVDLVDFATKLQIQGLDPQINASATTLIETLASGPSPLVIYEAHLSAAITQTNTENCIVDNIWQLDNAHGLSIYFPPRSGGGEFTRYINGDTFAYFNSQSQWDEFLQVSIPPLAPGDPLPDDVPIPLAPCTSTDQPATTQSKLFLPVIQRAK